LVIKIGVLELQGGYALHHNLLKKIGLNSIGVKSSNDLKQSNGLILPGGESTTLSLLIRKYNLREPIIEFAKDNPAQVPKTGLSFANSIIGSLKLYFLISSERVVDSPPGKIKPLDCFKSLLDLTPIEFKPIFLRRL
jgi:hypothetical protein